MRVLYDMHHDTLQGSKNVDADLFAEHDKCCKLAQAFLSTIE
jgi:hypothetical protein